MSLLFRRRPSASVRLAPVSVDSLACFPRFITRRFADTSAPFAAISPDDVAYFAKILPPPAVLSTLPPIRLPPEDLAHYNSDWMGKYTGSSSTVLKPRSTQHVSEILKWCHEKHIPVVPQGGNTGLVGGSVPLGGELILSLSSMNKVRSFDPVSGLHLVYPPLTFPNFSQVFSSRTPAASYSP
jgi:hypothetical protein